MSATLNLWAGADILAVVGRDVVGEKRVVWVEREGIEGGKVVRVKNEVSARAGTLSTQPLPRRHLFGPPFSCRARSTSASVIGCLRLHPRLCLHRNTNMPCIQYMLKPEARRAISNGSDYGSLHAREPCQTVFGVRFGRLG
jgi:hypothetical protein